MAALRRPFHTEEKERDVEVFKKFSVQVTWEGANAPFATLDDVAHNMRVNSLRETLVAKGMLPQSHSHVELLIQGNPLNPVQEALCGITVFGCSSPLRVAARVAKVTNSQGRLPSSQPPSRPLLEKTRKALASIVSRYGRQVLYKLFERFDSEKDGKLGVEELKNLFRALSGNVTENRNSVSMETQSLLSELDSFEHHGDCLTYAEFASCLPRHLSVDMFLDSAIPYRDTNENKTLQRIAEMLRVVEREGLCESVAVGSLQIKESKVKTPSSRHTIRSQEESKEPAQVVYIHPTLGFEGTLEGARDAYGKQDLRTKVNLTLLFEDGDPEGKGWITFDTLASILHVVGISENKLGVQRAEFRASLVPFRSHSGGYDYRAFLEYCVPRSAEEKAHAIEAVITAIKREYAKVSFGGLDLRRAFERFDPKNTGSISVPEFRQVVLSDLKLRVSRADLATVIDRLDPKVNNTVSYMDLIGFVERGSDKWGELQPLKRALVMAIREQFFDMKSRQVDIKGAFEYFAPKEGAIREKDLIHGLQAASQKKMDILSQLMTGAQGSALATPGNIHRILHQHLSPSTDGLSRGDLEKLLRSEDQETGIALANDLRKRILEHCHGEKGQTIQALFECMQCTCEDLERERTASIPAVLRTSTALHPAIPAPGINCYSLQRGCQKELSYSISLQAACRILESGAIREPFDTFAFSDFVLPGSIPSSEEVAARLRGFLKRRSLGGMALRRCFNDFDVRKAGRLSRADVTAACKLFDLGLGERDISQLFSAKDILLLDSQGCITFDEFLRFSLQSSEGSQLESSKSFDDEKRRPESPSLIVPPPNSAQFGGSFPVTQSSPNSYAQVRQYLHDSRPF